jgi:signal transduction histidine kinase
LLPLNVDGAVLYQVLQNLLSNAIKFSASGASVQLRTFRDADGAIGVSVRDQGVGIPAELIDKVTQPFWQRQGPLVHDHDGVGLGLAIVKSHVDALGGELRFDSQVGRGTTATVLLPVSRTIRPS